jgi:DNA-damage-inducible protein J
MSNIQIRITEKEKKEAKKVFDKLGLGMSTAIKIFLRQTAMRKGMPFLLTTENGLTLEQESEIIKASFEAKQGKNISRALRDQAAVKYLKEL